MAVAYALYERHVQTVEQRLRRRLTEREFKDVTEKCTCPYMPEALRLLASDHFQVLIEVKVHVSVYSTHMVILEGAGEDFVICLGRNLH